MPFSLIDGEVEAARCLSLSFAPLRIGEDDGGLDLAFGYGPIFFEQLGLLLRADFQKAVSFVKADGPGGVRPCADEDRAIGQFAKMREQVGSDSSLLAGGADVSVADEGDVLDL